MAPENSGNILVLRVILHHLSTTQRLVPMLTGGGTAGDIDVGGFVAKPSQAYVALARISS